MLLRIGASINQPTLFILLFAISIIAFVGIGQQKAHAAYDGGRIIDNSLFLDSKSMSASDVQSFLASKGGQIATRSFALNCDAAGTQAKQAYLSIGAPCGQTIPASQIIYYSAQVYGISPRVILSTLQKEQSLVTAVNPTDRQYSQAMGYACPTSGSCNDGSNFFYQIDNGTWVLRFHMERARGNNTYWFNSTSWTCGTEKNFYKPNLYPNQNVNFYDEDGVMYRTHFISNAATSSMYCYTPHAYNNPQGLYGRAAYGTTGRYYSGSYNFVLFYENWFGSTKVAPSSCDSRVADVTCVWRLESQNGNEFLTASIAERDAVLRSNSWFYINTDFYAFDKQVTGSIPVYRFLLGSGKHFYTTDTSERDSLMTNSSNSFEGIVFYVYPSTTSTNVAYPLYRAYSSTFGHAYTTTPNTASGFSDEGIRFFTPSGAAVTSPVSSGRNNVFRLVSRNGQNHFYTSSLPERDRAILISGYSYEGVIFDVTNSSTGTSVYRLYNLSSGDHYYTASVAEKDALTNSSAWSNEGIVFYIDNSTPMIYQLYNSIKGSHFYTASISETSSISNTDGWKYERVAFGGNSQSSTTAFYRMHSQKLGHFYTTNTDEILKNVNTAGWKYEGVALNASKAITSKPIYRLLNKSNGGHFYTTSAQERDIIVASGSWIYQGVAYYSSDTTTTESVFRLVNKNSPYRHFYTTSAQERDIIVASGSWTYEGIGWYN